MTRHFFSNTEQQACNLPIQKLIYKSINAPKYKYTGHDLRAWIFLIYCTIKEAELFGSSM